MNTRIIELLRRGKQILHEEGYLSFLIQALSFFIYWMGKLLVKIDEKVCHFNAKSRRERERERYFIPVSSKNLLDTKRILDKAGIRFWLMFGTFLGAYRDQTIIPYDKDTDLAIYSEDLPRLASCVDALATRGFELRIGPAMEDTCRTTLYRDGEHTGFAIFKPEGSKRVWKSIKYDASAFETFNEIQFLGQNFRILNDPERWLKYTYGEDWKTPIKRKGVGLGYAYGEKFESDGAIE